MNEIEKKALALLQECGFRGVYIDRKWNENYEALCRAIEQHEAFRQEVSEVCKHLPERPFLLDRFQLGDPVHVHVKREGQPRFPGYVVGHYTPRDGRHTGYVVEHERDGIIHVYPEAALRAGLE